MINNCEAFRHAYLVFVLGRGGVAWTTDKASLAFEQALPGNFFIFLNKLATTILNIIVLKAAKVTHFRSI